jgi:cytochrome c biogenesis protein CcdA
MKLLVTNSLGKGLGYAGLGYAPCAGPCFAPVATGARLATDAGTGWR